MKHIKPFNENKENLKEELKDFCETNLAYLLDEGGKVEVHTETTFLNGRVKISITNSSWSNIKDHMIPFLTRLKNNYHIEGFGDSLQKNGILIKGFDSPPNPRFPSLQVNIYPFSIEDLIKDNNPSSINLTATFSPKKIIKLEDLTISDFQFFIKHK